MWSPELTSIYNRASQNLEARFGTDNSRVGTNDLQLGSKKVVQLQGDVQQHSEIRTKLFDALKGKGTTEEYVRNLRNMLFGENNELANTPMKGLDIRNVIDYTRTSLKNVTKLINGALLSTKPPTACYKLISETIAKHVNHPDVQTFLKNDTARTAMQKLEDFSRVCRLVVEINEHEGAAETDDIAFLRGFSSGANLTEAYDVERHTFELDPMPENRRAELNPFSGQTQKLSNNGHLANQLDGLLNMAVETETAAGGPRPTDEQIGHFVDAVLNEIATKSEAYKVTDKMSSDDVSRLANEAFNAVKKDRRISDFNDAAPRQEDKKPTNDAKKTESAVQKKDGDVISPNKTANLTSVSSKVMQKLGENADATKPERKVGDDGPQQHGPGTESHTEAGQTKNPNGKSDEQIQKQDTDDLKSDVKRSHHQDPNFKDINKIDTEVVQIPSGNVSVKGGQQGPAFVNINKIDSEPIENAKGNVDQKGGAASPLHSSVADELDVTSKYADTKYGKEVEALLDEVDKRFPLDKIGLDAKRQILPYKDAIRDVLVERYKKDDALGKLLGCNDTELLKQIRADLPKQKEYLYTELITKKGMSHVDAFLKTTYAPFLNSQNLKFVPHDLSIPSAQYPEGGRPKGLTDTEVSNFGTTLRPAFLQTDSGNTCPLLSTMNALLYNPNTAQSVINAMTLHGTGDNAYYEFPCRKDGQDQNIRVTLKQIKDAEDGLYKDSKLAKFSSFEKAAFLALRDMKCLDDKINDMIRPGQFFQAAKVPKLFGQPPLTQVPNDGSLSSKWRQYEAVVKALQDGKPCVHGTGSHFVAVVGAGIENGEPVLYIFDSASNTGAAEKKLNYLTTGFSILVPGDESVQKFEEIIGQSQGVQPQTKVSGKTSAPLSPRERLTNGNVHEDHKTSWAIHQAFQNGYEIDKLYKYIGENKPVTVDSVRDALVKYHAADIEAFNDGLTKNSDLMSKNGVFRSMVALNPNDLQKKLDAYLPQHPIAGDDAVYLRNMCLDAYASFTTGFTDPQSMSYKALHAEIVGEFKKDHPVARPANFEDLFLKSLVSSVRAQLLEHPRFSSERISQGEDGDVQLREDIVNTLNDLEKGNAEQKDVLMDVLKGRRELAGGKWTQADLDADYRSCLAKLAEFRQSLDGEQNVTLAEFRERMEGAGDNALRRRGFATRLVAVFLAQHAHPTVQRPGDDIVKTILEQKVPDGTGKSPSRALAVLAAAQDGDEKMEKLKTFMGESVGLKTDECKTSFVNTLKAYGQGFVEELKARLALSDSAERRELDAIALCPDEKTRAAMLDRWMLTKLVAYANDGVREELAALRERDAAQARTMATTEISGFEVVAKPLADPFGVQTDPLGAVKTLLMDVQKSDGGWTSVNKAGVAADPGVVLDLLNAMPNKKTEIYTAHLDDFLLHLQYNAPALNDIQKEMAKIQGEIADPSDRTFMLQNRLVQALVKYCDALPEVTGPAFDTILAKHLENKETQNLLGSEPFANLVERQQSGDHVVYALKPAVVETLKKSFLGEVFKLHMSGSSTTDKQKFDQLLNDKLADTLLAYYASLDQGAVGQALEVKGDINAVEPVGNDYGFWVDFRAGLTQNDAVRTTLVEVLRGNAGGAQKLAEVNNAIRTAYVAYAQNRETQPFDGRQDLVSNPGAGIANYRPMYFNEGDNVPDKVVFSQTNQGNTCPILSTVNAMLTTGNPVYADAVKKAMTLHGIPPGQYFQFDVLSEDGKTTKPVRVSLSALESFYLDNKKYQTFTPFEQATFLVLDRMGLLGSSDAFGKPGETFEVNQVARIFGLPPMQPIANMMTSTTTLWQGYADITKALTENRPCVMHKGNHFVAVVGTGVNDRKEPFVTVVESTTTPPTTRDVPLSADTNFFASAQINPNQAKPVQGDAVYLDPSKADPVKTGSDTLKTLLNSIKLQVPLDENGKLNEEGLITKILEHRRVSQVFEDLRNKFKNIFKGNHPRVYPDEKRARAIASYCIKNALVRLLADGQDLTSLIEMRRGTSNQEKLVDWCLGFAQQDTVLRKINGVKDYLIQSPKAAAQKQGTNPVSSKAVPKTISALLGGSQDALLKKVILDALSRKMAGRNVTKQQLDILANTCLETARDEANRDRLMVLFSQKFDAFEKAHSDQAKNNLEYVITRCLADACLSLQAKSGKGNPAKPVVSGEPKTEPENPFAGSFEMPDEETFGTYTKTAEKQQTTVLGVRSAPEKIESWNALQGKLKPAIFHDTLSLKASEAENTTKAFEDARAEVLKTEADQDAILKTFLAERSYAADMGIPDAELLETIVYNKCAEKLMDKDPGMKDKIELLQLPSAILRGDIDDLVNAFNISQPPPQGTTEVKVESGSSNVNGGGKVGTKPTTGSDAKILEVVRNLALTKQDDDMVEYSNNFHNLNLPDGFKNFADFIKTAFEKGVQKVVEKGTLSVTPDQMLQFVNSVQGDDQKKVIYAGILAKWVLGEVTLTDEGEPENMARVQAQMGLQAVEDKAGSKGPSGVKLESAPEDQGGNSVPIQKMRISAEVAQVIGQPGDTYEEEVLWLEGSLQGRQKDSYELFTYQLQENVAGMSTKEGVAADVTVALKWFALQCLFADENSALFAAIKSIQTKSGLLEKVDERFPGSAEYPDVVYLLSFASDLYMHSELQKTNPIRHLFFDDDVQSKANVSSIEEVKENGPSVSMEQVNKGMVDKAKEYVHKNELRLNARVSYFLDSAIEKPKSSGEPVDALKSSDNDDKELSELFLADYGEIDETDGGVYLAALENGEKMDAAVEKMLCRKAFISHGGDADKFEDAYSTWLKKVDEDVEKMQDET